MRCFLSEENLTLHKREFEKMRSRLSIYEKSLPEIKNMSIKDVRMSRIDKDYKEDILYLKRYLMLHSVYFSSFSEKKRAPNTLLRYFSSRESFAYECLTAMRPARHGFLCLYKTNGAPGISILHAESQNLFCPPALCIEISDPGGSRSVPSNTALCGKRSEWKKQTKPGKIPCARQEAFSPPCFPESAPRDERIQSNTE